MKTIMLAGAVIIGLNAAQAAIESPEIVQKTLENLPAELGRSLAGVSENTEYFIAADTVEAPDVLMPASVKVSLPEQSVDVFRTSEPLAVQASVRAVGNVVYLAQAPAGNPAVDPATGLPSAQNSPFAPVAPRAPSAPRAESRSPFKAGRLEAMAQEQRARAEAGKAVVTANRLEMILDKQGHEGRSLVISSHEPDPKNMAAAEEDLNVMSRILEKAMEQKPDDELERRVMGIRMTQGGDGLKNLLIEDYGAIFMLRANFPLSGPPEKKAENQPKETTNSTWEQAKRELYGPSRGGPGNDFEVPHIRPVEQPFDPKRVENMKESILESLKNATNIRGLKEDDFVTVVVRSGDGASDPFVRKMVIERSPGGEGLKMSSPFGDEEPPKMGPRPKSTLTIKAKKADIDAFAKGKIDMEGFRKKVSMTLY